MPMKASFASVALPCHLHRSVGAQSLMVTMGSDASAQSHGDLAAALAISNAILESATGGVLVTSFDGRTIAFNQQFVQLWRLDHDWSRQPLEEWLARIAGQVQASDSFIARFLELLTEPEQVACDIISMNDESVLERYSRPFIVAGKPIGRLWSYRNVSERVAAERALKRRDALLESISATAEHLLENHDFTSSIPALLAKLGAAAVVSRVYIFQNFRDEQGVLLISQRYEWCAPGITSELLNSDLQNLPYQAGGFSRWEALLSQGRIIHGNVADFPASERMILEAQSIRTLLIMPIRVGTHWWGFMGFDECARERVWSSEEIDTLKIAARMLGSAIRRYESERELLSLNSTLEQKVAQRTAELTRAYERVAQSLAERHAAYALVVDSAARHRALLKALPDTMLLFQASGELLEWQAGGESMPYPVADHPHFMMQIPEASAATVVRYQEAIARVVATRTMQNFEYTVQCDDQECWFEARLVMVDDERVLALVRDSTERKRSEVQLQQLALHDALTRLPNRTLLYDRIAQALQYARRYPEQDFALLLLDLDDFKRVNDGLGHEAGDKLLVETARRLSACLRSVDTVARLGGDEFAILLAAPQDQQSVVRGVERVRQAVAMPFNLDDYQITVGVSVGVVLVDTWRQEAADLLRNADIALYRAKEQGKGQYAIFDATMHAQVVAHIALETELRVALEQAELRVYYQPMLNLKTSQLQQFEALIRWQHPVHGLLPPAAFLPLAEKLHLDVAIDRWVLREACRQLQVWQSQTPDRLLTMSVNLSHTHLEHGDLVGYVTEVLQDTGILPKQLILEVTERSLIGDDGNALTVLSQLSQMGVNIGLDDFGTGYSSLSYLHYFPVNVLKLDRTFVQGQDPHNRNQEILRTVIDLARVLDLEVIAEGVETETQFVYLQALSCDYLQGYFIAPPLDPAAAERALHQRNSHTERLRDFTHRSNE